MDILAINKIVNEAIYGREMMVVFILVGLYLSIRMGFPQFTRLRVALRETVGAIRERSMDSGGQITPFQAAMVAMAATVGTGHVVGMVSAVIVGGPGAVVWMWIAYLVGMATKFAEAVLSVHFRLHYTDNSLLGGPMAYIRYGLGKKAAWLAVLFAIFTAIAAFGTGNVVQSATVSSVLFSDYKIPPAVMGLVMAVLVAVLMAGGIRTIARFSVAIVVVKLLVFFLGILPLLVLYIGNVGEALGLIFTSAFSLPAVAGGVGGFILAEWLRVLLAGVGRGIFANEAGLGSAAIAHAQAQVDHPVRQGFWGITEMLVSLTVTSLTAITFIASGIWEKFLQGNRLEATRALFAEHPVGPWTLTLILAVFAIGTMVAWSFYGEEGAAYLFGEGIRWPYRLTYAVVTFMGSMGGLAAFSDVADTLNGMMAIPNLIALVALAGLAGRLVREFFNGMAWEPPEQD
jgi:alanine or glycine:cation symporter, AGCS family